MFILSVFSTLYQYTEAEGLIFLAGVEFLA